MRSGLHLLKRSDRVYKIWILNLLADLLSCLRTSWLALNQVQVIPSIGCSVRQQHRYRWRYPKGYALHVPVKKSKSKSRQKFHKQKPELTPVLVEFSALPSLCARVNKLLGSRLDISIQKDGALALVNFYENRHPTIPFNAKLRTLKVSGDLNPNKPFPTQGN